MKFVHPAKTYFRSVFSSEGLSLEQKVRFTRGLFSRKSAYIFAAGPSIKRANIEKLFPQLSDSLTIGIKQGAWVAKEMCDFQILNYVNYSDYDWKEITHPVGWVSFDSSHPQKIKDEGAVASVIWHAKGNGKNNTEGFANSMAVSNKWDMMYEIGNGYAHWGPGLMYEIAIPLALLCGAKRIFLVGWDIGKISKSEEPEFAEHFYGDATLKHKFRISNEEITIVSRSSTSLNRWLASQGVSLYIVSDQSLACKSIERAHQEIFR